jgi:hypothetical protein
MRVSRNPGEFAAGRRSPLLPVGRELVSGARSGGVPFGAMGTAAVKACSPGTRRLRVARCDRFAFAGDRPPPVGCVVRERWLGSWAVLRRTLRTTRADASGSVRARVAGHARERSRAAERPDIRCVSRPAPGLVSGVLECGSTNVIMCCVSRPAPRVRVDCADRDELRASGPHRSPRERQGHSCGSRPRIARVGERSPAGAKRSQRATHTTARADPDPFDAWPGQSSRPAASRDGEPTTTDDGRVRVPRQPQSASERCRAG